MLDELQHGRFVLKGQKVSQWHEFFPILLDLLLDSRLAGTGMIKIETFVVVNIVEGEVLVVVRQKCPGAVLLFVIRQALVGKVDLAVSRVGLLFHEYFVLGQKEFRPERDFDLVLPEIYDFHRSSNAAIRVFGVQRWSGFDFAGP